MESVDVLAACWRHLPLEVQAQVVSQEVAGSQPRAPVQRTLTHI